MLIIPEVCKAAVGVERTVALSALNRGVWLHYVFCGHSPDALVYIENHHLALLDSQLTWAPHGPIRSPYAPSLPLALRCIMATRVQSLLPEGTETVLHHGNLADCSHRVVVSDLVRLPRLLRALLASHPPVIFFSDTNAGPLNIYAIVIDRRHR